MVFLFSGEKSRERKELLEILLSYGAKLPSSLDPAIPGSSFPLFEIHSPTPIKAKQGTAIFTSDCGGFLRQQLPATITGICEEGNRAALSVLKANEIPTITCGMNQRNTLTLSSVSDHAVLAGLQRTLTDKNGCELPPAEYPISLKKAYSRFSIMAAAAALLLEGISPECF